MHSNLGHMPDFVSFKTAGLTQMKGKKSIMIAEVGFSHSSVNVVWMAFKDDICLDSGSTVGVWHPSRLYLYQTIKSKWLIRKVAHLVKTDCWAVFVLVPVSSYKKASQVKGLNQVCVHRSQVRKTKTEFQLTQLTSILACQLFDWRAASSDWTASSFSVPGQCSLLKLRFKIGLWFVMKFTGPLPRFNPPELSLWQSKTSEGHWAPKPIKNSL